MASAERQIGRGPLREREPPSRFANDERWSVRQVSALCRFVQREEATDDNTAAVRTPALAAPDRVIEGVEAVVDRDLVATGDVSPSEDYDSVAHRVRVTGVVEVAAGGQENCARVEVEFTQVPLVIWRELVDRRVGHDAAVTASEDELARREGPLCEHAEPLRARGPHLDIADHADSLHYAVLTPIGCGFRWSSQRFVECL